MIMKKYVILFVFLMSFVYSYSQSNRHTSCDSIDSEEAVWLNIIASKHGVKYDFTSKKVAFYTGSGGGARTNKQRFFSECNSIKKFYPNEIAPLTQFYIFDEKEKARTGGYDAVIIFGSVKQFPSRKALIRRLHCCPLKIAKRSLK